jgi:TetR/AcrR family transcriptional regulator, transcriptional repressor for nem operon
MSPRRLRSAAVRGSQRDQVVGIVDDVARDGTATRLRIMDAAQALVIARGFSATTVDEVIAAAHTTKGGFFNHFPTKQALAHALMERYAAQDAELLATLMARSERLADDPLQQLLLFLGLLTDELEEWMATTPGCLMASFSYERELVDDDTEKLIVRALRLWGDTMHAKLQDVARRHPPKLDVNLQAVADQVATTIEGSYVMVRALGDVTIVRGQMDQLRAYLRLLFAD